MSHYAIDQWVDFSRGLLGLENRTAMLAHLDTGCAACAQLSKFTSDLTETCAGVAEVRIPDSALRLARAIFPYHVYERPQRGNRVPVELMFDSFLVPSPAGLRSTWQVGWQGLYRAGECSVDLRIEPELKSTRAAVIGQITNHTLPDAEMSNLQISLLSGKTVVAETVSNRFGEFQLEYEEQAQLKLCISLADSRVIQVPLKKLTSEQTAGEGRKASRRRAGGRK